MPRHAGLLGRRRPSDGTRQLRRSNGAAVEALSLDPAPVRSVTIVGGTHGNEANGVALLRHFQRNVAEVRRESFATQLVIANPLAVEQNRRYVDKDLNRCFATADLQAPLEADAGEEVCRAKVLDSLLGPKSSCDRRCDFVIDLHNTTSNCGVALMMAPNDALSHEVAHAVRARVDADINVVEWQRGDDWPMLPTCARSGITVEAGPVATGCRHGGLYAHVHRVVMAVLDFLEARNTSLSKLPGAQRRKVLVPVFSRVGVVRYPTGEEVVGMVHPSLQDRDFGALREGDPLFLMTDGSTRQFKREEHGLSCGAESLYPIFVNEAAYYESGIALAIATRGERFVESFEAT